MDSETVTAPKKNTYSCFLCRYKSDRKSNLSRHQAAMHGSENGMPLFCCDTQFCDKQSFKEHQQCIHNAGYGCQRCSKVFANRHQLRLHQGLHETSQNFFCSYYPCLHNTSRKGNLDRHQRRCRFRPSATFLHQTRANSCASGRNERSESGVPLIFVCRFCNVGFAMKKQLLMHSCPEQVGA